MTLLAMDEGAPILRSAFAAAARQASKRTDSTQAHCLFADALQYCQSAHRPQIGNEKSALRLESGELVYSGESALPWAFVVTDFALCRN
jgi:hypothetical protein